MFVLCVLYSQDKEVVQMKYREQKRKIPSGVAGDFFFEATDGIMCL
jgi:hypothetical protein